MSTAQKRLKSTGFYFLILFIFTALGSFLYGNTLHSPFVFDDFSSIVNNHLIRISVLSWAHIKTILTHSYFRPLPALSFALNYYFDQYNLAGFHLVNIAIQIFNGFLLFIFTRKTLKLAAGSSHNENHIKNRFLIPLFAALLWFVHPLDIQSVTYIVQRMNSMAAMFYLLSALMYIKARETQTGDIAINRSYRSVKTFIFFLACLVFGLCAVLSKQNAVTLPAFIIAYELFFFREVSKFRIRKILPWIAAFVIAIIIILLMAVKTHQLGMIFALYKTQDFTMIQRLLTEPRVVLYYISLFVFPYPSRLMLEYNYPISHSLMHPLTAMLSLLAIIAIVCFSFYIARKGKKVEAFCLLCYLGTLSVESSFIGLALIWQYRTYLPFMFLSIFTAYLLFRYLKKTFIPIVLLCAVITVFSIWTYQRNRVWGSQHSLYSDNLKKADTSRLELNVGISLYTLGDLNRALHHCKKALEFYPYNAEALFYVASVYKDMQNFPAAVAYFKKALAAIPIDRRLDDPDIQVKVDVSLGSIMLRTRHFNSAIDYFKNALLVQPDSQNALMGLGLTYIAMNQFDSAINTLRKVAGGNSPMQADACYYLGRIFYIQGRYQAALKNFERCVQVHPGFKDAAAFIAQIKRMRNAE